MPQYQWVTFWTSFNESLAFLPSFKHGVKEYFTGLVQVCCQTVVTESLSSWITAGSTLLFLCKCDDGILFQAKVNNASLVGIGYTQTLRPGKTPCKALLYIWRSTMYSFFLGLYLYVWISGMKLVLSALVDGKNINAGGHKLGLGLELEAWGSALPPQKMNLNTSWTWPGVFLSGQ